MNRLIHIDEKLLEMMVASDQADYEQIALFWMNDSDQSLASLVMIQFGIRLIKFV